MDTRFSLPSSIEKLVKARNLLRDEFSKFDLNFTLDGNLIGDIGEAIASELFGLNLVSSNTAGFDALAVDGRKIQIKATGTGRGPAFRMTEARADHLIFLNLNFDLLYGNVVYNGPEHKVISSLPEEWKNQRSVSMTKIRAIDDTLQPQERLKRIF